MSGSTLRFFKMCIFIILTHFLFSMFLLNINGLTLNEILFTQFIMLLISLSTLLYSYIILHIDFQKHKKNKSVLKKLYRFNRDNNIFYTDNIESYYFLTKDLLKTIKKEQLDLFENKGYVLVIGSAEDLSVFTKQSGIMGLFSKSQKYILLYTDFCSIRNNRLEIVDDLTFKKTFYHEWGHFLDYAYKNISYSLDFQKKFLEARNKFKNTIRFSYVGIPDLFYKKYPKFNSHELIDASEYFASNYSKYRMNIICDDYFSEIFEKIEE